MWIVIVSNAVVFINMALTAFFFGVYEFSNSGIPASSNNENRSLS